MAQYLVLIYENEESWAKADEATAGRIMGEHESFGAKHGASLRGGNALEPSMTATSIRKNASGESVTTDPRRIGNQLNYLRRLSIPRHLEFPERSQPSKSLGRAGSP